MITFIEQTFDVTDEALDYVRAERKFWANRDQDTTLTKVERKEAQRWVKVCTIALESMYGTKGGKVDGEPLRKQVDFPLELHDKLRYLYMQAFSDCKPYAELLE